MTEPEKHMDGSAYPDFLPDDAWIERLLRDDAAHQAHIDDAGFSGRVMASLPPRRKPVVNWLLPSMTALGCATAATMTPAGGYLVQGLTRLTDLQLGVHLLNPSSLLVLVPIAAVYYCCFSMLRDS